MSSISSYGNLLPFQKLAADTGGDVINQAVICPVAFCLCAIIQLLLPIEQLTAQDFGGYVPPEEDEHIAEEDRQRVAHEQVAKAGGLRGPQILGPRHDRE